MLLRWGGSFVMVVARRSIRRPPGMSDVQTRVAAIVGHLPDADEIASILADEIIGSPLDILDAVGHLLGDDAEQLAATLAPIFCESTSAKRPRIAPLPDNGNGGPSALDKLSWRREYMSHEQRFVLPYNHAIEKQTLVLEQTAFGPEGFASTIWTTTAWPRRWAMNGRVARYAGVSARPAPLGWARALCDLVGSLVGR